MINKDMLIERQRCLQAIDDEEEFPGDMPDEMWEALNGCDRQTLTEALRLTVKLTKQGIRERVSPVR